MNVELNKEELNIVQEALFYYSEINRLQLNDDFINDKEYNISILKKMRPIDNLLSKISSYYKSIEDKEESNINYSNDPIETLHLSPRVHNLLKRKEIYTVGELVNRDKKESIIHLRGLGIRAYSEINEALKFTYGIKLNDDDKMMDLFR